MSAARRMVGEAPESREARGPDSLGADASPAITLERRGPEPLDVKDAAAEDLRLWSVTTIIGVLDKPALLFWAAEQTAKEAIRIAGSLPARVAEDGTENTVKWLRDARFRRPKDEISDAEFGTGVHALLEEYTLTGHKPTPTVDVFKKDVALAQACLDQFDRWAHEHQPEYLATEVTVYNATYGYAGTCDCFLSIGGVPLIGDYKSSKKSRDARGNPTGLYSDVALQLAAYRYAELAAVWRARRFEKFRRRYYLLSQDERDVGVPVPEVVGGVGIKVTPEHCTAYPVRCDDEIFDAFLYMLEAARWSFDLSQRVIGEPLVAPERVA